ncbi:MAG: acetyl-CoA decarbonylase/synthase complex subunit gamma [Planctomycetota bacterium]
MALTGLEIYKLLPKTNCKKCGFPTCLAFAMQLAQKKVELSKCPDASEEAKKTLEGAAAPPIRLVKIGSGEKTFQVGQETAMFRHDDRFYNPCGIVPQINDDLPDADMTKAVENIKKLQWVRIGMDIGVNMVALNNHSNSADAFTKAATNLSQAVNLPLILMSDSADNLKAAGTAIKDKRPLIVAADSNNFEVLAAFCKEAKLPLAVKGKDIEETSTLTSKLKELGVEDLVILAPHDNVKDNLHFLTKVRRAALRKTFRPLGYPVAIHAYRGKGDTLDQLCDAAVYIAKYGGIVILDTFENWQILPLVTLRQNIYTNPQKPIAVEPKLYKIGEPNENSPLLFTTNFSLTYYSVEGEVEASRVPAYLLAVDTEGLSVLTAYSGDKLNEKVVAKAIKDTNAESLVKHKKLIIPGLVAVMSGKLEEETGWQVVVGPKEAAYIPKFLQTVWK